MTGESWSLGVPLPAIRVKYGVIDFSRPPGWHFSVAPSALLLDLVLALAVIWGCVWLWQKRARKRKEAR
jgi:hypothetical protein